MKQGRLFIVGPDQVGNSHVADMLQRHCQDWVTSLDTGVRTQELLKNDAAFAEAYEESLSHGWKLPHEVCCQIMNSMLQEPLNETIVITGFNLDVNQIEWSKQRGLMGARSITAILTASFETCWSRYEARRHGPGSPQMSRVAFREKYLGFKQHLRELQVATARAGGRLTEISADLNAERHALPSLLQYAQGLRESRAGQHGPQAGIVRSLPVGVPA